MYFDKKIKQYVQSDICDSTHVVDSCPYQPITSMNELNTSSIGTSIRENFFTAAHDWVNGY